MYYLRPTPETTNPASRLTTLDIRARNNEEKKEGEKKKPEIKKTESRNQIGTTESRIRKPSLSRETKYQEKKASMGITRVKYRKGQTEVEEVPGEHVSAFQPCPAVAKMPPSLFPSPLQSPYPCPFPLKETRCSVFRSRSFVRFVGSSFQKSAFVLLYKMQSWWGNPQ